MNQQGALQIAERRFFIVEKTMVMVYNELLNFCGCDGKIQQTEIGGYTMELRVSLAIAAIFVVLGIIFAAGKGANLIAGYNTASREEKAKTDEKKLLKAMAVLMFILAGCVLVSALGQVLHIKPLIWTGQAFFAAAVIIGLIYLNTGARFRR